MKKKTVVNTMGKSYSTHLCGAQIATCFNTRAPDTLPLGQERVSEDVSASRDLSATLFLRALLKARGCRCFPAAEVTARLSHDQRGFHMPAARTPFSPAYSVILRRASWRNSRAFPSVLIYLLASATFPFVLVHENMHHFLYNCSFPDEKTHHTSTSFLVK